jgi:hypothetical protein
MCRNSLPSLACRTLSFAAVLAQFFKVFTGFLPSSETPTAPVPKLHILHSRRHSLMRGSLYSLALTLHLSVPHASHLEFRTFRAQPPCSHSHCSVRLRSPSVTLLPDESGREACLADAWSLRLPGAPIRRGPWVFREEIGSSAVLLPPHSSPVYRARSAGVTPTRSPPGGAYIFPWILGFAHNRLTIADFRDVRLLGA